MTHRFIDAYVHVMRVGYRDVDRGWDQSMIRLASLTISQKKRIEAVEVRVSCFACVRTRHPLSNIWWFPGWVQANMSMAQRCESYHHSQMGQITRDEHSQTQSKRCEWDILKDDMIKSYGCRWDVQGWSRDPFPRCNKEVLHCPSNFYNFNCMFWSF